MLILLDRHGWWRKSNTWIARYGPHVLVSSKSEYSLPRGKSLLQNCEGFKLSDSRGKLSIKNRCLFQYHRLVNMKRVLYAASGGMQFYCACWERSLTGWWWAEKLKLWSRNNENNNFIHQQNMSELILSCVSLGQQKLSWTGYSRIRLSQTFCSCSLWNDV